MIYCFQELKPKGNGLKYRILENYAFMANKNKSNIEKSLSHFMEIATAEVCLRFLYVATL
jgi:hypothetical protein